MKRLTITIDTDEHAAELEELLAKLNYVISIEEESPGLSAEEDSFVNERIEYYNKNEKKALSFEEFTAVLKSRYGV